MRRFVLIFFMVMSVCLLSASVNGVSVTAVTAQQRYPWNGLVDITVTMQGTAGDLSNVECIFVATNSATKTAISIAHISQNGDDVGSGNSWTRKFIWDAKADMGAVKIDDIALTVDTSLGVQLWKNGPYWARCNVGATKPEEYGYYFWWGDTVGYKRVNNQWNAVDGSRTGFEFCSFNCPTEGKSNAQLQSAGYIDASGNLTPKYDAATKHWGTPWRMPTDAEFSALVNNCDCKWTTRNGISGQLVKGRGAYASRSIFLPAAGYGNGSGLYDLSSDGYYWSSTPYSGNSDDAWNLYFYSSSFGRYSIYRELSRSIRPLRGFAQ